MSQLTNQVRLARQANQRANDFARQGMGAVSLDHGVLNVPLSKRGNIDAQIDTYKRAQRAESEAIARETRKAFAEVKREALALIAAMTPEHIARIAPKLKCQSRSVAKRLRSEAGHNPSLVVRALREGGAA